MTAVFSAYSCQIFDELKTFISFITILKIMIYG